MFFNLIVQGILTYFALARHRRDANEVAIPTYMEPPPDHHTPYPPTYAPTTYTPTAYSAYPSRVSEIHQQPPFTSERQPQGDTGYLPSDYQPSDYQPSDQQPSSYQPPSYWDEGRSHTTAGGGPDHLRGNWLSFICADPELYRTDVDPYLQCGCRDTAVYALKSDLKTSGRLSTG